ncbi:MAG: hypothetical protein H0T65_00665, partial [Deltaproteobacteria bacterium]|nr:hypothetical protein [Deltaproteobacteria bacterium]
VCFMAAATPALADDENKTAPPTAGDSLPAPQSDNDVAPPVASPAASLPDGGIVKQAGVGGTVGYGRAGVLELGGSAGFMVASDFRNINVSPSIGWFLFDNFELTGILSVSNIKTGDESATLWSALVEPSYHVPFNRTMFAFGGLGVGASYVSEMGTGLAIAPRIGMNFMVGRSGVLTPSLSYEYTTHDVDSVSDGDMQKVSLVQVSSAVRFNVGYTAMW